MSAAHDLAIVIAAGGKGVRIGGNKPALKLGGQSLLARAVEKARHWSSLLAIAGVIEETPADVTAHIPQLVDVVPEQGPLMALRSAFSFAAQQGYPYVLLMPCDMPFLPDDLPERLLQGAQLEHVVVARSGSHIHPICSLWQVEMLAALDAYYAEGKRSLMGLAETIGYAAIDWPVTPIDLFFNINTPDDLQQAENWHMKGLTQC